MHFSYNILCVGNSINCRFLSDGILRRKYETTKDKAGSLPPSVYTKEQEHFNIIHLDSAESNVTSSDTGNVMVIQPAASNVLNSSSETVKAVEEIGQLDEYETDSDSDNSISEQLS